MFDDGSSPTFHLPDSRGQELTLSEFLGRQRIVLAFSPDRDFLEAADNDGLNDRDLIVLVIVPPNHYAVSHLSSPPLYVLMDYQGHVTAAYGLSPGEPWFCLIGKDGTIKEAQRRFPTLTELYATVDSMPMRRQEMRERQQEG